MGMSQGWMTPHEIEHTEKDVPGYVLHLHPTQSTVSQLGGNKVSLFTVTAAVEGVRLKLIADR